VKALTIHLPDALYAEIETAATHTDTSPRSFAEQLVESEMAGRRLQALVCGPQNHHVPEREARSYMGSSLQHFSNEETLDPGEAAGRAGYTATAPERATDALLHESVQAADAEHRSTRARWLAERLCVACGGKHGAREPEKLRCRFCLARAVAYNKKAAAASDAQPDAERATDSPLHESVQAPAVKEPTP
jgi:hypothetical protein